MDKLVDEFKKVYKDKGPLDDQSNVHFLHQIADFYQSKEDWASLVRAQALYNSCMVRDAQNKAHWSRKAFETQLKYWSDGVDSPSYQEHLKTNEKLRNELEGIREKYRLKVNDCQNSFSRLLCEPRKLMSDENDTLYREILQEVPQLSKELNQDIISFTRQIVDEAVAICGPAPMSGEEPCKFSIVAMGSLARGETTPYSDLEFMLLTESKGKPEISYFETLSVSIYFLIGNLQETKLKYMAVPELMNWSEEKQKFVGHWFNDCCKNGFKIDGLGDWAGNIPTGGSQRQHNQFICTVDELVQRYTGVLENPDPVESLRGDLTAMLASTVHIYGDETLHNNFRLQVNLHEKNPKRQEATLKMLQNDVEKFNFEPGRKLTHIRDAKWDIYRYPSLLILDLKILHGLDCSDPWVVINQLEQRGVLSAFSAVCLRFSLCCGVHTRLAAYFYHDSQSEAISVLSSEPTDAQNKGVWCMPQPLLIHMFIHLIALKKAVLESIAGLTECINAELTDESRTYAVCVVSVCCQDYPSVVALLQLEYPGESIFTADPFVQNMLAFSATGIGDYEQAEKILKRKVDSDQADSVDYRLLGRLYSVRSLHEYALEYYRIALAMELAMNQEDEDIASLLTDIGSVCSFQGDCQEALECYRAALEIQLQSFGPTEHAAIATSYNNIGNVLLDQGDNGGALENYKKALDMWHKLMGNRSHAAIATAHNNIGLAFRVQGDYKGASNHYKKALEMRLRVFGDADHLDIVSSYLNFGVACECMANYSSAYDYCSKALEMSLRIFKGADHPMISTAYTNIAGLLRARGNYVQAVQYFRNALDMSLRLAGNKDQAPVARSYNNVGLALDDLGDKAGALEYYQKSLGMSLRLSQNADHVDVAKLYNNIASAQESLGNYTSASDSYKKALNMWLRLFDGKDLPELATTYNNIGTALQNGGDYVEALEYYQKALDMKLRIFGSEDHTSVAASHNNIGLVLFRQKKYQEALEHYRKALGMWMRVFQDDSHPYVAAVKENIAMVREATE